MTYQIDKTVPVPSERKHGDISATLRMLKVGESFKFAVEDRNRVATHSWIIKKQSGRKFCVRKIDATTARVWRTE